MSLDFYVECLNCNTKYTNPINSLCSNCGKDIFTALIDKTKNNGIEKKSYNKQF